MSDETKIRAALDRLVAHTAAELDLVDEEVRAVRRQAHHDLDDVLRGVGIDPQGVSTWLALEAIASSRLDHDPEGGTVDVGPVIIGDPNAAP